MKLDMLYTSDEDGDNKVCKLCGRACGDHFEECPGDLIESLEFQVRDFRANALPEGQS